MCISAGQKVRAQQEETEKEQEKRQWKMQEVEKQILKLRSQNTGSNRRGEGATIGEGGERECRKGGGRVETAERRNTSEDNGKCRREAKRSIKKENVQTLQKRKNN